MANLKYFSLTFGIKITVALDFLKCMPYLSCFFCCLQGRKPDTKFTEGNWTKGAKTKTVSQYKQKFHSKSIQYT